MNTIEPSIDYYLGRKDNTSFSRFSWFSIGLIITTILSASILSSSLTSATSSNDSVVDEINITVPISCSLTGTGMNTHNAEIPNGTYTADIGTTTLKAFCNDNEGFAIYAAGYTGNEIGGTNSNKLVGTAASSNATIVTGTATSAGNPDISNWAMKLALTGDSGDTTGTNAAVIDSAPNELNGADASFSSYHVVPNKYTKVAHKNSTTSMDTTTGGVTLTTTYAAYISKTQIADTYSGQVIYTLVHPTDEEPVQPRQATAGCINYFANASTAVGTMGCQSVDDDSNTLADGATVTLLASNFSRTGYGFAGWSDAYDYKTNANAHFYGPMETITAPEGTTANGLSLYAVWVKSAGSLQDSNQVTQLCGTGNTGGTLSAAPTDGTATLASVSALTDQRDNQTYAIAKLADGKCWTIENLRLEANNTRGITNEALAQGYGKSTTYGNFIGLADAESANFYPSVAANSIYYSGTQSGTASIDVGDSDYRSYRIPRYNNLNTQSRSNSPDSNSFSADNTTPGMYSYGNYYNWRAALANTIFYNSITAIDSDGKTSDTVGTSLCPSGWKLPRGGMKSQEPNNDFWQLVVVKLNNGIKPANYNNATFSYYDGLAEAGPIAGALRSFPNNVIYSGWFYQSQARARGQNVGYWSSNASNNTMVQAITVSDTKVDPTGASSAETGRAIRCMFIPSS